MNVSEDYSNLSFADDLIDAGEAQVDWMKTLVYGSSGTGKTHLIATMPDPALVLLTEKHGGMTIKRVNPKAKIMFIEDEKVCNCHGRPVAKCGSPQGVRVRKAHEKLYSVLDELASKKTPFRSVALDSLTDLQQILLHDRKGGKPGGDVSLKEWGKLIDETKHVVVRLRNLNMHVGVICLADESQDDENRMIYRPALAGKKLPNSLIQYFNLCCFQRKMRDKSSVERAVHESVFDAGEEYHTKTHPALAPIEIPNMRLWVEKMDEYAREHGEGEMPTESAPVSEEKEKADEEEAILARLKGNPKIEELFERLGAPRAKVVATLKKYPSDEELISVLEKRLS